MFQAYLDESGYGSATALVMAGFIATAEQWTAFSNEWQQYLEMKPKLLYFKMSEANGLAGEFSGWTEDRRNERLALLHQVVLNHAVTGMSMIVPTQSYNEVVAPHVDWQSIYQFAVYQLMSSFIDIQIEMGLDQPINFIFDDNTFERSKIYSYWDDWKRSTYIDRQLIGASPVFRDEKKVLPLQAADLLVWWERRRYLEEIGEVEGRLTIPKVPSESRRLTLRQFTWTQAAFEEHRDNVIKRRLLRIAGLVD